MIARLWRRSLVRGVAVAVRCGVAGARVHPRARVDARRADVAIAPGVTVAERCVLTVRPGGSLTLAAGVRLGHDCEIETDGRIAIGAGTTVQRRSSFNGNVTIGAGCIVAPNVFVSSGTHLPGDDGTLPDLPVVVGDHCWLGVNAVIMPGVTIGDGAVVGANSVVTRDVDACEIVAGAPARPVSVARTHPR